MKENKSEEKDELYDRYLHSVGNLLILEANINISIRNNSLLIKKQGYSSSSLKLPQTISDFIGETGLWTYESILNRQKALAEIALNVWSL